MSYYHSPLDPAEAKEEWLDTHHLVLDILGPDTAELLLLTADQPDFTQRLNREIEDAWQREWQHRSLHT